MPCGCRRLGRWRDGMPSERDALGEVSLDAGRIARAYRYEGKGLRVAREGRMRDGRRK
jgi:hypothetical protein